MPHGGGEEGERGIGVSTWNQRGGALIGASVGREP